MPMSASEGTGGPARQGAIGVYGQRFTPFPPPGERPSGARRSTPSTPVSGSLSLGLSQPAGGSRATSRHPSNQSIASPYADEYTPPDGSPLFAASSIEHAFAVALENLVNIGNTFHLSNESRKLLSDFQRADAETRSLMLFGLQLAGIEQFGRVEKKLSAVQTSITRVEKNTRAAWKLNDAQMKVVKRLVWHWLTSAIAQYGKPVTTSIMAWIAKHPERLQLEDYKDDTIKQQTVYGFVNSSQNSIKSNVRKMVFLSVENKLPVSRFSGGLQDKHLEGRATEAERRANLAQHALMRKIALPLYKKKKANGNATKGADTGFWGALNTELKRLKKLHGNGERKSDAWIEWANKIITEDEERYPDSMVGIFDEGDATDDDEEDLRPPGSFLFDETDQEGANAGTSSETTSASAGATEVAAVTAA
ncbi:hypothetical protein PENSPDRAFT_751915 [Peniophora sp. CONT]|nr:hypothetical protein PENSPDRAFT_751915 [Peniophora sp. CONT]